MIEDHVFRRLFTGARNLSVAQALGCANGGRPVDGGRIEQRKSSTHHGFGDWSRRQLVSNHGVEPTEYRAVEELGVIGRRDDKAVGFVLLHELQERVQYAPNLADVVFRRTLGPEGVELVE